MPGDKPKIFPDILLNDAPEGSGLNSNDKAPKSWPAMVSRSTEKSVAISTLGSKLAELLAKLFDRLSLFSAILAVAWYRYKG